MTSTDRVVGSSRSVYDIGSGAGVQLLGLTHFASSEMRNVFVSMIDGLSSSSATTIGKTDASSWRSSRCPPP